MWNVGFGKRHFLSYLFFFLLLIIIYSNSFHSSWHFDDYVNITKNSNIHIDQLNWGSLKNTIFGIVDNSRISRPIAFLSFALNYYLHGLNVYGYHVVNFLIHYLTTLFLFLFIYHTLNLPLLKERYEKHAYSIALLSTVFWSVNPVHVSAVTYIVQRMASMAALFYIMSMYFFLKFRTSGNRSRSLLFIVSSIVCALLAVGSKENAVMLPFIIFIYDLFFIQGLSNETLKRNLKIAVGPILIILLAGLLFYDFSSVVKDYEFRPFTMKERLLTEPRVVLFYITLLFYPITSRLTLIHDFQISKSLIDPWTTLAAILIIFLIIAVSLFKARKWPLIAYCILFFFLNHVIEGSLLSLELVYEHRNYLPSMLLFVPLAVAITKGLDYFVKQKMLFFLIVGATTFLIVLLSVTSYIQNDIMKDEISLWSDNVQKSPRLHHPRQCLAVALFLSGRLPEAFIELTKAVDSYESGLVTKKSLTYGCLGEYYLVTGDDDRALDYLLKSINLYPPHSYIPLSFDRAAIIYMRKGLLDQAEAMARKAISLQPREGNFYLTYSAILVKQNRPDAAIKEAQKALRLNLDSPWPYRFIAMAYKQKNNGYAEKHFRTIGRMTGDPTDADSNTALASWPYFEELKPTHAN